MEKGACFIKAVLHVVNESEQREIICNNLRLIPSDEMQTVFGLSPSLFSQPCRFQRAVKSASFPPGEAKEDFTYSPKIPQNHNHLPQNPSVSPYGLPAPLSGALFSLPPLGVVLRAANRDSNDCRWQSYLCFVPRSGKGGGVGDFELLQPSNGTPSVSPFGLPAPPLGSQGPRCPLWGWCSAQRIKIVMIAGGNHTSVSCREAAKGVTVDG